MKGNILPSWLNSLVLHPYVKNMDREISASKIMASGKEPGFGLILKRTLLTQFKVNWCSISYLELGFCYKGSQVNCTGGNANEEDSLSSVLKTWQV